ncbi:hypothetical protein Hanom_Chr14g01303021 [Helianthus anomalus]
MTPSNTFKWCHKKKVFFSLLLVCHITFWRIRTMPYYIRIVSLVIQRDKSRNMETKSRDHIRIKSLNQQFIRHDSFAITG